MPRGRALTEAEERSRVGRDPSMPGEAKPLKALTYVIKEPVVRKRDAQSCDQPRSTVNTDVEGGSRR